MVARHVWDVEAAGSNPATPTRRFAPKSDKPSTEVAVSGPPGCGFRVCGVKTTNETDPETQNDHLRVVVT